MSYEPKRHQSSKRNLEKAFLHAERLLEELQFLHAEHIKREENLKYSIGRVIRLKNRLRSEK
jgi:hypothetical protein